MTLTLIEYSNSIAICILSGKERHIWKAHYISNDDNKMKC